MKKLRYSIGLTAILGVCASMLVVVVPSEHMQSADGDTGAPLPHALVVTDTGQQAGMVGSER